MYHVICFFYSVPLILPFWKERIVITLLAIISSLNCCTNTPRVTSFCGNRRIFLLANHCFLSINVVDILSLSLFGFLTNCVSISNCYLLRIIQIINIKLFVRKIYARNYFDETNNNNKLTVDFFSESALLYVVSILMYFQRELDIRKLLFPRILNITSDSLVEIYLVH